MGLMKSQMGLMNHPKRHTGDSKKNHNYHKARAGITGVVVVSIQQK